MKEVTKKQVDPGSDVGRVVSLHSGSEELPGRHLVSKAAGSEGPTLKTCFFIEPV